MKSNQIAYSYLNSPLDAVRKAGSNTSVMVLNSLNGGKSAVGEEFFRIARQKNIRVYVETPGYLPNIKIPDTLKSIKLERGVVTTKQIKGVDSLAILGIYDHSFIPLKNVPSLIVVAKVAGYDKADYGLSETEVYPMLFKHEQNLLVATLNLSDYRTSRFGPEKSVKEVWKYIIGWLRVGKNRELKQWGNDVTPTFQQHVGLKPQDFRNSVYRGSQWFYNAKLFIHPTWEDLFKQRTAKNGEHVMFPPVVNSAKMGNGELGILEGHGSTIYKDGSQPIRWWLRGDCQAETAYALSLASVFLNEKSYKSTSANLLSYLYHKSNLRAGERNDPKSPSYGLVGWATTDADAYYGDDNARVILATIGSAVALNNDEWNKYIVEAIVGNFRTTGKNGFRRNWFRDYMIQKAGWKALSQRDLINVHPHYESWLWATYLWLYDKTKYEPFLALAKKGISITMEKYPNWKWTNGIQQERARMILPLAWLVRVEDTPQHRKWLKTISSKLLENLSETGAIREELGADGAGKYGKIKSNKEYGLHEAPLISENGDPVADLLYTTNFAFFALNEAYGATKDASYKAAVDKMADFLVKIQIKSATHKDLDGGWYRAFDYNRWDYWASNADSGWGPWGTLTGWTQSWILTTLIMQQQQQNFWDYSQKINQNGKLKTLTDQVTKQMLN